MIVATPRTHVLFQRLPRTGRCLDHRRRFFFPIAHAAAREDEAQGSAAPAGAMSVQSQRATNDAKAPAGASSSLPKDYSHTLFHSECLEVLGLIDLESLRKRPRLTVGVTVKASVVLPVLVVLAALYLTDMAKGLLDWTHLLENEDVGD